AQTELKPGPRARLIARRLLERPHVVECGSRIFIEAATLGVMAGKDQRIEDGFGSARLNGFIRAVLTIAVVWFGLFPKAYTLGDIVQESSFVGEGASPASGSRRAGRERAYGTAVWHETQNVP